MPAEHGFLNSWTAPFMGFLTGLRIEGGDGCDPGGILLRVDLAQVEQGLLVRMSHPRRTHAFDDAEVSVEFAVLEAGMGAEEQ